MNAELDLTTAPARGNTKAAMKAAGARSADLWQVDPRLLQVMPGFNVRQMTPEYEAHIEELTASIIANGYYPDRPIAGYVARQDGENVIFVIDGHTRLEAVLRAIERGHAVETVPVVIKPAGASMEDLTVALVTSNSGRPLSPLEVGLVCKRLLGMGVDERTIAQRLGYTRTHIDNLLMLTGADRQVRDLVSSGKVSATLAMEELRRDIEQAPKRLQEAVQEALAQGKAKATKKHMVRPEPAEACADTGATKEGGGEPASQQATTAALTSLGPDTDLIAWAYHGRLVMAPENNAAHHLGELRYQPVRLDDYIDALEKFRDLLNSEWDDRVPASQPNEHGVYTNGVSLRGTSSDGSHAAIHLARDTDGWRFSASLSLSDSGQTSLPGKRPNDSPVETATAAVGSAAMEMERLLRRAAMNKPDHARTQKAVRQLMGWLTTTLTPDPELAEDDGDGAEDGAGDAS